MDWIINNLPLFLGFLGTGSLTTIIAYIFGGKQAQKQALKKGDAEIKKESATAIEALQNVYDKYIEHDKVRTEKLEQRLDNLEKHNLSLQVSFNEIQLAYAKEVERSQNWEKLHRELKQEFDELNKKYDILLLNSESEHKDYIKLKDLYDRLKKDFDKLKKETA